MKFTAHRSYYHHVRSRRRYTRYRGFTLLAHVGPKYHKYGPIKRVGPPDADFPGSSNLQIQFLEEISRPRRWNLSGFHALHLKFSQPFFFLLHWFRAHIPFSLQSEAFSSKQFIILRIVPSSKALKVTDFFFLLSLTPPILILFSMFWSGFLPMLELTFWAYAVLFGF